MQKIEALYPEQEPMVKVQSVEDAVAGWGWEKNTLIDLFLYQPASQAAASTSSSSDSSRALKECRQPLCQIHFAVRRGSDAFKAVVEEGNRRQTISYSSNLRQAYLSLSGTVVLVEDPDLRRRYYLTVQ